MFKRSFVFMLVCVIVISFAGCGQEKSVQEATVDEATKKDEMAEEKEEPLVIEWMGYDNYAEPKEDAPTILALEEKLNVDFVVWQMPADDFQEVFSIRLAGGDLPDVFKVNIKDIPNYQKQGILGEVPLETIFKLAPTVTERYNEYSPDGAIWSAAKYDGINYGMPKINLAGIYGQNVVWRKDWLDNVGISKVPETLEEFEEALYAFRHDDPDGNGEKDTYGLSDYAQGMIFGAYGIGNMSKPKYAGSAMMLNEDNLPVMSITQPGMKEALTKLNEWYEKEIIDPEFITSEDTSGYWAVSEAFQNSRIGLTSRTYFYHWWDDPVNDDEDAENVVTFKVNNPDGEYVFGEAPIGPDGHAGTGTQGYIKNAILFTTKATEDPRKVEAILKMWDNSFIGEDQDPELYELLNYGVEGETFEYDQNGEPQIILEGHKKIEEGLVFALADPLHEERINKDMYDFAKQVSPKDNYPKLMIPPTEEYSQYKSDIRRMGEEAVISFITGERPIDEYDEFIETYLKHGGQEVTDAIQRAWISNSK